MDVERVFRQASPYLGLVMFLGTYVAFRRRKFGHAQAIQDFPEVAKRMGLTFRSSPLPGGIGSLRGTFRSREVFVDPDDRPRVVLYFSRAPAVIMRTYEHEKRQPPGMVRFDLGTAFLNGFFKDRYASVVAAEDLIEMSEDIAACLEKIMEHLGKKLAHVSVTSERIELGLDFGRPAHVPADTVELLLPIASELSDLLEEAGAPQ